MHRLQLQGGGGCSTQLLDETLQCRHVHEVFVSLTICGNLLPVMHRLQLQGGGQLLDETLQCRHVHEVFMSTTLCVQTHAKQAQLA